VTVEGIPAVHENALQRFDLSGRVAWVVGGAGLLGTAVCHALAEHGAHVVVSDIREPEAAKLAEAIRGKGLSAEALVVDASSEESIVAGAKTVVEKHGRMDCVVNMTFFYTRTPMDQMTTVEWEKGMRVSLTGAFLVSREAIKHMSPRNTGSIVHFSSMYGLVAPDPRMYPEPLPPNPIDYGVAKAGVLQMTRYHGVMLARQGVRVNAIVPGPFPYPEGQQDDTEFMARLRGRCPTGRFGQPSEITGAVVFLCSDAASYVTGTQIVIDGGWTAW